MRTELLHLALSLLAWCACFGCTDLENLVPPSPRDAGPALDASLPDASAPDDAEEDTVTFDAGVAYCGNRRCQCSDGVDNDGDGLADGLDPECTGATDDSEADFGTGIENPRPCQDCFFDRRGGGRGAGADGCERFAECSVNPLARPPGNSCGGCEVAPDSACVANCQPLTPNGCDCFGCCSVFNEGRIFNVLLRAGCSMQTLDDVAKCTPCIQASTCLNPCDGCELCPGRTRLPASCATGRPDCSGLTPCDRQEDCVLGQYCLQGCCFPVSR